MVHAAPVRIPNHIGPSGEKGVCGIATGKGQLVNVLTWQAAPPEIFTGAVIQTGFVDLPTGAKYFGGSGGRVIGLDHDILEQRPVHSHVLAIRAVDRHVPTAKG
jgi:hypothetical protein